MNIFKKAQIGIFIIISLIIVISGILLFTFNSTDLYLFSDKKGSFQVKEFIDSCLHIKSNEAVYLLGIRSGWLYHPELLFTDKNKPDIVNKKAQGLDLFGEKIPYWFYYDDVNEEFKKNIPQYNTNHQYSLKSQMERFIKETIMDECFYEFEEFQDRFEFEYNKNEILVETIFYDDKIDVNLNFDILVKEKNSDNSDFYQNFRTNVENKLFVPYHIAKDIVESESKTFFFEKRVLSFLTPYQTIETKDSLPPFYDFKLIFDIEPWNTAQVKDLTKNIINSYMPEIKFYGTAIEENSIPQELESSQFARGIQNMYTKDYLTEHSIVKEEMPRAFNEYKNFQIKPTFYQFFPFHFSLGSGVANFLLFPKPESIINMIPFFFTEYSAVYEMSFPTLIEISPKKVSNRANDNFVFNLAIELNIDYNSPLGEKLNIDFDPNQFESFDNMAQSLICDPVHFISDEVSINITDPINFGNREFNGDKIGVEDAIVNFNCAGLATCFITQTKIDPSSEITQLNFRLPINCPDSSLEIYKFGHQKIILDNLNPQISTPMNFGEKEMSSAKELKLNLNILDAWTNSGRYDQGKYLREKESGFLILTDKIDEENTVVINFNSENIYDLKINLRPGNYSIQSYIIYQDNLTIPQSEICYRTNPLSSKKCQTIPSMDIESWITGGIEIENFELTSYWLLQRDEITINLLDFGIPNNFEKLGDIGEKIGNLNTHSSGFIPYLS